MTTLGVWLIAILIAIIGVGVLVEIDDLIQTLRLMDVSCPTGTNL